MNLPVDFLARMKTMLDEEYPDFLASYDAPLCHALRHDERKLLPDGGLPFPTVAVPWSEHGFYYEESDDVRPGKHPWHEAGVYYIQEASAQLPASLCPPAPGDKVLDLCAAPGGKATALGAALHGEGMLIANEISGSRAAILSQNIERMGIPNAVVTSEAPATLARRFPAFFDKIVVDAPCSGEGMFRKEPQAAEMWSPDNVATCAARQLDILSDAAVMLAPDGYLTYSTCTFAPEENEGVLMAFLQAHPDFEVVDTLNARVLDALDTGILDHGCAEWVEGHEDYSDEIREAARHAIRVFPHHAKGEGHFAVLLHRTGEAADAVPAQKKKDATRKGGGKGKDPVDAAMRLFTEFARETLVRVPDGVPRLFGDRLYLLPAACPADLDGLRILRAGLCVGTVKGERFEPDHALALALRTVDAAKVFTLDTDSHQDTAYLHGDVLPCAPDMRSWHLVTVDGFPIGWGKASGGMMKNHYPKGLRR
jgi:16S rRNA C967 or C1407 C5-methylase (RsmB/RsmF family)/NOL1/NOP2/fmu family ribosome biogenesis protein